MAESSHPRARVSERREKLVLLPGWALGPAPLVPLAAAIERRAGWIEVECFHYPPFESRRLDVWLAALDTAIEPDVWLGGWSLGGMLAASLASARGERARGLVTLGSNACFVARPDWSVALARPAFEALRAAFQQDPVGVLGRLVHHADRSGEDVRRLLPPLFRALGETPLAQSAAGLALLQALDLRQVLPALVVPQLHLFGEQDLLVPAAARRAIQALMPSSGTTQLLSDAGHDFPLERAEACAEAIVAFMTSGPTGVGGVEAP